MNGVSSDDFKDVKSESFNNLVGSIKYLFSSNYRDEVNNFREEIEDAYGQANMIFDIERLQKIKNICNEKLKESESKSNSDGKNIHSEGSAVSFTGPLNKEDGELSTKSDDNGKNPAENTSTIQYAVTNSLKVMNKPEQYTQKQCDTAYQNILQVQRSNMMKKPNSATCSQQSHAKKLIDERNNQSGAAIG